MNCKNCNNVMYKTDKYCRKCGTKYQTDNLIIIKKIYYPIKKNSLGTVKKRKKH